MEKALVLNMVISFNPHNKFIFVLNNLLCTHYGRIGHLDKDCQANLRDEISLTNYVYHEQLIKKGPGPFSKSKKAMLPI